MKRLFTSAMLWIAACSPAEWPVAARATEIGAIGSLACDGGTTQQFMSDSSYIETNPVLGQHPSNGAVWAYLGAIGAIAVVANRFLPAKAATVLNVAIIGIETKSVIHNIGYGSSVCGIGQGGPWGDGEKAAIRTGGQ